MKKNIMILGTASSVGKSTIATALCRFLKKRGYDVAPFKALNVTSKTGLIGNGEEIGRAQIVQAEACEIKSEYTMNPILIKSIANKKTKVIVNGKSYCHKENCSYEQLNKDLKEFIKEDFEKLADKHNNIIVEGEGSCIELGCKNDDLANFYTAKLTNSDVILVANSEEGGVFASIYGTIMLLNEEDRKLVKGIIINKFKSNKDELENGIKELEEKLKIPVLGVIPYEELNIEDEVVVTERLRNNKRSGLNIGIIKLSHISNLTDFYPLELEKNVNIRYVKTPKELEGANLIILPGSKSIMYDLNEIKSNGLYDKIIELHKEGATVMGICAGFQMLGRNIINNLDLNNDRKCITGFEMLPLDTKISFERRTVISNGIICSMENELKDLSNIRIYGYEIQNGYTEILDKDGEVFMIDKNNNITGLCNENGDVFGTYVHGIFEIEEFRKKFINHLKEKYNVVIENSKEEKENYKRYKLKQYDKLCKILEDNIDTEKILNLLKTEEEESEEKSLE